MTKYTDTKIARLCKQNLCYLHTPLKSDRFKRNKPCPCGSGKKFKVCHNPSFVENRHRWAASVLYNKFKSPNVFSVTTDNQENLYINLHNDYSDYYPKTYTVDNFTYNVITNIKES